MNFTGKSWMGWALFLMLVGANLATAQQAPIPQTMNGLPLVYSADFSQGASDWEPTDASAWKVIEDAGVPVYSLFKQSQYEPPVRSPVNQSLIQSVTVSDFVMETTMRSTKDQYPHRDMCIFFNWQDASHFYYVHIAPAKNSDPHANSIFIVNGAPRLSIATQRNDGTEWKDGVYHTIRLIRDTQSGLIFVYFDNLLTPIMTAQDKTFTSGRVGVGSFDDIGNVKTFVIWGNKN